MLNRYDTPDHYFYHFHQFSSSIHFFTKQWKNVNFGNWFDMKTTTPWQSTNCEQIFSSEVLSKQLCVGWCASKSSSFVLLINPLQECNTAFTALRSRGRVKSSSGTFDSHLPQSEREGWHFHWDLFTARLLTKRTWYYECKSASHPPAWIHKDNSQNDSTDFHQSADLCWPFRFRITSLYC